MRDGAGHFHRHHHAALKAHAGGEYPHQADEASDRGGETDPHPEDHQQQHQASYPQADADAVHLAKRFEQAHGFESSSGLPPIRASASAAAIAAASSISGTATGASPPCRNARA